jgi:MFS family permease
VARPAALPLAATAALGMVTIVGFGAWFYGYGVLLEPIRADTGWSETAMSSTYGASLLAAGVLATLVGRALPHHGARRLYLLGAPLALASHLAAAAAGSEPVFVVAGLAAGAVTGALGYYAVVHTLIAQLVTAEQRARAITVNTLWGAFASPVFLPLLAWLVLRMEWRPTLRVIGVLVAGLVPRGRAGRPRPSRHRRGASAAAGRAVRRRQGP